MEGLQWFAIGVLSMLTINAMVYIHMTLKPKWYTVPILLVSLLMTMFGLAWGMSSYLEGYAQSSALGLLIFSGAGIVLAILAVRFLVLPNLKKVKTA